jgi:hypothetical protein
MVPKKGGKVKKIRVIMLSLVALAIMVFPAFASASGGFVADQYPLTLHGEEQTNLKLSTNLGFVSECSGVNFEGALSSPSEAASSTSTSEGFCSNGPFKMNGCQFTFHPGSQTFDIGPSGCGPVIAGWSAYCILEIQPGSGRGATYENVGSGSSAAVRISIGGSFNFTSPGGCSGKSGTLTMTGSWDVKGTNSAKEAVGVKGVTSGSLPVGVFMSGNWLEGKEPPHFNAQIFPAKVSAQQDGANQFNLLTTNTGLKLNCSGVTLNGGTLSESTKALNMSGELSGCSFNSEPATVSMNSCSYHLPVSEGPFTGVYEGLGSIECSKAGDAIELTRPECTIRILPQAWGYEKYKTEGSGSSSVVGIQISDSETTFERVGLCLGAGKSGSSGGHLTLRGTY